MVSSPLYGLHWITLNELECIYDMQNKNIFARDAVGLHEKNCRYFSKRIRVILLADSLGISKKDHFTQDIPKLA